MLSKHEKKNLEKPCYNNLKENFHNYPWPKTENIYNPINAPLVEKAIKENQKWNVTIKMDGCNMCVSSNHYVASKNRIVADKKTNYEIAKWNGLPLKNFEFLIDAAKQLKIELLNVLKEEQLEVLVYGELLLPGISTSKHDVYDYRNKKFNAGDFLAFGLGIVCPNKNVEEHPDVLNVFSQMSKHESLCGQKIYYIKPLDEKLTRSFVAQKIRTVPWKGNEKFVDILTNLDFIDQLEKKKLEGFVINNGTTLIKWKHVNFVKPETMIYLEKLDELFQDLPYDLSPTRALINVYYSSKNYVSKWEHARIEEYFSYAFLQMNQEFQFMNEFREIVKIYFINKMAHAMMDEEAKNKLDPAITLQLEDYIEKKMKPFNFPHFFSTLQFQNM